MTKAAILHDPSGLSLPATGARSGLVIKKLIQWLQKVKFDESDETDIRFSKRKSSSKGKDRDKVTESAEQLRRSLEDYQNREIPAGTITEAEGAMPDGPHAFAQRLAGIFGKRVARVFNHRPDLVSFDGVSIGNNLIYLNALTERPL